MVNGFGKSVSALGLMVALGAIVASSSAAHADCLSACLGTCANNVTEPFCRQVQHSCRYDQCASSGGRNYSAPAYGAIAFSSDTGSLRLVQQTRYARGSRKCGSRAMREASVGLRDRSMVRPEVRRRRSRRQAGYGHGWGDTEQQAQSEALKVCRQGGDDTCEVKVTACSNREPGLSAIGPRQKSPSATWAQGPPAEGLAPRPVDGRGRRRVLPHYRDK